MDYYSAYWSGTILDEVQRNLVEEGMTTPQRAQSLMRTLRDFFPDALVTNFEHLIPSLTNHPKDRHVLAAAVAVNAPVIVTSNLRDFPPQALAPVGVTALPPDTFLTDLFHAVPETMTQIVIDQAAQLRMPPVTVDEVLARLALQAPTFSTLVRERLTGSAAGNDQDSPSP